MEVEAKDGEVQEAGMTRQHRLSESFKSTAGATLVGAGLHLLWGNLDRAASHWSHPLGAAAGEALGVLPSIALALSQVVQAGASDHREFVLTLLRILISFWPLLLVIAGTILLREAVGEKVKALPVPARYFQNKDAGCRFCCPSFDA
jgi:hypothetical protein